MKKLIIAFLVGAWAFNLSAQDEKVSREPFQISMIPPLATSKISDTIIYNSSINVFAGYIYGLEGVEFGSLVNIVRQDAGYAQFAGLANLVGGKSTGIQAAGLANLDQKAEGVQMAGLVNASQSFKGAQLAGLMNIAEKDTGNVQLAGMANFTAGHIVGMQGAGLINFSKTVDGAQVSGLINAATEVEGTQISGLINYAKRVKGVQIGVINVCDTIEDGLSIGVINVVRKGLHQFEVSSNDVTDVNLSFRSGTNTFYGIFTSGIQTKSNPLWVYGMGFGTRFPVINDRFMTSIEATSSNVNRVEKSDFNHVNLLNNLSINLGYKLSKKVFINAGPVLNVYVSNVKNSESGSYGYDIGKHNFFDHSSHGTNTRMWVGYRVGIWF